MTCPVSVKESVWSVIENQLDHDGKHLNQLANDLAVSGETFKDAELWLSQLKLIQRAHLYPQFTLTNSAAQRLQNVFGVPADVWLEIDRRHRKWLIANHN